MPRPEPATFEPERILEVLNRNKVRYVIIGGIATTLYGSPYPTEDLDVTPDAGADNLARLAQALKDLNAREWDPRKDTSFARPWSEATLKVDKTWVLMTDYGGLDLLFEPAGTRGFPDLSRTAIEFALETVRVRVAALEDIIRCKEAAGRERDQQHLPTLRKLWERREAARRDPS